MGLIESAFNDTADQFISCISGDQGRQGNLESQGAHSASQLHSIRYLQFLIKRLVTKNRTLARGLGNDLLPCGR